MRISEAFPSKYLQATDLQGKPWTLTINEVREERMGRSNDYKPVIYFRGGDKGLVVNANNARLLAAAYGDETDDWHGQRVILRAGTWTDREGQTKDCINVEVPEHTTQPQATAREPDPRDALDEPPF